MSGKKEFHLIFITLCLLVCPLQQMVLSKETPSTLMIYSKISGEFTKVERFKDVIYEDGTRDQRKFIITVMKDRDDEELEHIKGNIGGKTIEGRLTKRDFDLEMNLKDFNKDIQTFKSLITDMRGNTLEIEYSERQAGSALKRSLTASLDENEIKIYSEDEEEKTSFYIIFNSDQARIFGSNMGVPVDYTVTYQEVRGFYTRQELISGSISLVLAGYFIF